MDLWTKEYINNNIFATVIDFGLAREDTSTSNVISTNYITSPESLLTISNFSECLINNQDLQLDKHDYFGLFSIILNLFINKSFWGLFSKYLPIWTPATAIASLSCGFVRANLNAIETIAISDLGAI